MFVNGIVFVSDVFLYLISLRINIKNDQSQPEMSNVVCNLYIARFLD